MLHHFGQRPGGKGHDGGADGEELHRHAAVHLRGQRGNHSEVHPAHHLPHVLPESEKPDEGRQPRRPHLSHQPGVFGVVGRPSASQDGQKRARNPAHEPAHGLDQQPVALLLREPPYHPDQEAIAVGADFRQKPPFAFPSFLHRRQGREVNRIVDGTDAPLVNSELPLHLRAHHVRRGDQPGAPVPVHLPVYPVGADGPVNPPCAHYPHGRGGRRQVKRQL